MIARQIGKLVTGKTSDFQIASAAVLGSLVGFSAASGEWGMFAACTLVVVVVNAHLAVVAAATAIGLVAGLAMSPVSGAVGAMLLDGPTQPLFRFLVNAPVTALIGFENYAATGGLVVGSVVGAGLAWFAVRTRRQVRAGVLKSTQKFDNVTDKKIVKLFATFVLGLKLDPEKLAKEPKRFGRPVRILGVAAVALAGVVLFTVPGFFAEPILTSWLIGRLESAVGATVNLDRAEISLSEGRLKVVGLQIADPEKPTRNLIEAGTLEADFDAKDLLRKRIRFEQIVIAEAHTGKERAVPGERKTPPPAEDENIAIAQSPDDELPGENGDLKRVEEVFENAQVWKDRLDRAADLLERFSGDGDEKDAPAKNEDGSGSRSAPESSEVADGSRATRSAPRGDRATHLIEDSPTVRIDEVRIERIDGLSSGDVPIGIRANHLSTHPSLVDEAARVEVHTFDGKFHTEVVLGAAARSSKPNHLEFALRETPTKSVMDQIRTGDSWRLEEGHVDVIANGNLPSGEHAMQLPVDVVVKNAKLFLSGQPKATPIDELKIPVVLEGTLRSPRVRIDPDVMQNALIQAGHAEVARRIAEAKQLAADKANAFVNEAAGDLLDGTDVGNVDVTKPDEVKKQVSDAARKKAEEAKAKADAKKAKLEAEAKKKAEEGKKKLLDGLWGGDR